MSEEDESEEENVQQKVTKRDNCKLIVSSIKFVLYASYARIYVSVPACSITDRRGVH